MSSKQSSKPIKDVIIIDDEKDSSDNADPKLNIPPPQYLLEMAKSSRAECKRCSKKITKSELRVGVINEGEWGLFTKWQHLECTIFHESVQEAQSLDGFFELSTDMKQIVIKRIEESKQEIDPDRVLLDPNEVVRTDWVEEREPPETLLMPLLPYQKEGLGWMVHQEQSDALGGILADEMGMGKTIQAISLILDNRPLLGVLALAPGSPIAPSLKTSSEKDQHSIWSTAEKRHEDGSVGDAPLRRGSTLIILPTVALRQWQSEIARFTTPRSISVLVYHGQDRATNCSISELTSADVVLTSYKLVEMEYRKATAGTKVQCRLCGRRFYPEKLRVHRKYFCGEGAKRTEAQARTQKKLARAGTSGRKKKDNNDEDESDSSEDEITKQKKKNKQQASTKKMKNENAKKKLSPKRSLPTESSDDDISDNESTPTVIPIKKKSLPDRAAKLSKMNGKSKTAEVHILDNDEEGDSDEDEYMPSNSESEDDSVSLVDEDNDEDNNGAGQRRKITKVSPLKKSLLVNVKQKTNGFSGNKKANASNSDLVDTDDDDGDDNSSSSEDEVSLQKRRNKEKVNKTAANKKRSNGNVSVTKKEKTNGKMSGMKKQAVNNREEEEEDVKSDSEDSQVERDITRALAAAAKLKRSRSPLHEISWFRVILDEAHLIKDRSTSTARAVFNLVSLNKWCLTGTPLQNRVGELYSLVRFLRVDPHAYYFCKKKGCSCKSLHYRFTKGRCNDCDHSVMLHFCHFNKHILNPIKRCGYIGDGRTAMLKLKEQVLDEILLRRTKTTRADDIQLPPRIVRVWRGHLDEREEDFYQALYTQSQAQFNTYVHSGTVLNNYAHIFDILIRLRQAVDHPYLVIYGDKQHAATVAAASSSSTNSNGFVVRVNKNSTSKKDVEDELECVLCHETSEDPVQATCHHVFCRLCVTDYLDTLIGKAPPDTDDKETGEGSVDDEDYGMAKKRKKPTNNTKNSVKPKVLCPACNKELTIDLTSSIDADISPRDPDSHVGVWDVSKPRANSILSRIDLSLFQSSTKMEALMQELHTMGDHDPGAKAIVFSQFVNMLDLLEHRMRLSNMGCVKLVGNMNIDQRDMVIKKFQNDSEIRVLLISLKAGGVALNLTVASHIFLMDPWWNPAAEMQAIDRTHRIAAETIEERILQLQVKKKLVFDGTVGGDTAAMARLTVDDMRFLFQ